MSKIQDAINACPKEHEKKSYKVFVQNKKGELIRTVLVIATSPRRAELAGVRVSREVFSEKKAFNATSEINTTCAKWA
jgi:hypothetical protein